MSFGGYLLQTTLLFQGPWEKSNPGLPAVASGAEKECRPATGIHTSKAPLPLYWIFLVPAHLVFSFCRETSFSQSPKRLRVGHTLAPINTFCHFTNSHPSQSDRQFYSFSKPFLLLAIRTIQNRDTVTIHNLRKHNRGPYDFLCFF